jgi:hypothetical protein
MTACLRPTGANRPGLALAYPGAIFVFLAATGASSAIPALAADSGSRSASQALFIGELALLLVVGRLMGEAVQRIGQPSVMGQLIGGLLLGPSFFGLLWPTKNARRAKEVPDPVPRQSQHFEIASASSDMWKPDVRCHQSRRLFEIVLPNGNPAF